jgi:hypothetical protein
MSQVFWFEEWTKGNASVSSSNFSPSTSTDMIVIEVRDGREIEMIPETVEITTDACQCTEERIHREQRSER